MFVGWFVYEGTSLARVFEPSFYLFDMIFLVTVKLMQSNCIFVSRTVGFIINELGVAFYAGSDGGFHGCRRIVFRSFIAYAKYVQIRKDAKTNTNTKIFPWQFHCWQRIAPLGE